jgi:DNA repair exonuclease SbcCD nuclease subunit
VTNLIKILHTADIHLDSPLKSLAMKDEDLQATVKTATRAAFMKIVDTALFEEVSALLISGDLFDGAERSAKTAAFLTTQLDRLLVAGIPVFYIKGNHDAENPITGEVSLPENVHVFDGRGGKRRIENSDVWIHGVSFSGRQAPESLLPKFGATEPDAINIAMLHTSLAGSQGHDTYAPCSVAELTKMGFDYWALGHVHKRQVHSEAPWIIMPGIPQGRDIGEAGPKSATLLTIDEKNISVSEVPTSAAQFIEVRVSADSIESDDELRNRIRAVLLETAEGLVSDAGLVRLSIGGKTARKWQILRDQDSWREVVAELARSTGVLWVERTKFEFGAETAGAATDTSAVTELGRLMDQIRSEPAFTSELRASLETVLAEIPTGRRSGIIPDEAAAEDLTNSLSEAGAAVVLAAMKGARE